MDLKRSIDAATKAALAGPFHPITLVYLDWPAAPVRAHSGVGDILWGGHTWRGVGAYGGISAPAEAVNGVPSEAAVSLIAPFAELAEYLDDPIRNRAGEIYSGIVTRAGGNILIGAPWRVYTGTMDAFVLKVEGGDALLYEATITLASGPGYRTGASIVHSDEDQRRRYSSDTGMSFLKTAGISAKDLSWPA